MPQKAVPRLCILLPFNIMHNLGTYLKTLMFQADIPLSPDSMTLIAINA